MTEVIGVDGQAEVAQGADEIGKGTGEVAQEVVEVPSSIDVGLHPEDQHAKVTVVGEPDLEPEHLRAEKSFKDLGLPQHFLDAFATMGFVRPSKIQEVTIPAILQGKNVTAQAQTGSGKSACFIVGMLNAIDTSQCCTQALCLGPSRELILQLYKHAEEIAKYMPGVTMTIAIPQRSSPDIPLCNHLVFGTPGTVKRFVAEGLLKLDTLKVCAIDEADEMIKSSASGPGSLADQTKAIFKKIPNSAQILLFSATFGDDVRALARKLVRGRDSVDVKVNREELSLDGIRQFSVFCPNEQKFEILDRIFSVLEIGQTIIFVRTRADALELSRYLTSKNHSVGLLTGELSTDERDRAMGKFMKGITKVLVATNVLSRGIDVLQVTLIVNFDIPKDPNNQVLADPETYLHRSGRSARFGRKGVTLNFVDRQSQVILNDIATYWDRSIEPLDPNNIEDVLEEALKNLRG